MGNKNRRKYGVNNIPQTKYQPAEHVKKSHFSNRARVLTGVVFLVVIAVAFIFVVQSQSPPSTGSPSTQGYQQNVAPVFFSNPTIAADGAKASIPASFVYSNKLVFIDVKLAQKTDTLEYQGRTIPLAYYRGGEYLPLIAISTPSGKTITGIRVCEPCGSFSFHIVQGKNLKCDLCGAEWDVETFAGVSGGCQLYPPPKLSATVSESVEIDLSPLQTAVTA